jgi:hypothetical protein
MILWPTKIVDTDVEIKEFIQLGLLKAFKILMCPVKLKKENTQYTYILCKFLSTGYYKSKLEKN